MKNRKAAHKKTTAVARYTEAELHELEKWYRELALCQIEGHYSGGMNRVTDGLVAELRSYTVLRMAEERCRENPPLPERQSLDLMMSIGDHVAAMIVSNDAEYFEQLAVVLRARKAGKPLNSLARSDLKIKSGRGRKSTAADLSVAFPLALCHVTKRRSLAHSAENVFTRSRITREELAREIQRQQSKGGRPKSPRISESRLSEWISNFSFIAPFMAEQPIARKSRLKA